MGDAEELAYWKKRAVDAEIELFRLRSGAWAHADPSNVSYHRQALDLVDKERHRQERLYPGMSIASSALPPLAKLRVCMEELGEVAEALDVEHANTKRDLMAEVTQLAACGVGTFRITACWLLPVFRNDHGEHCTCFHCVMNRLFCQKTVGP